MRFLRLIRRLSGDHRVAADILALALAAGVTYATAAAQPMERGSLGVFLRILPIWVLLRAAALVWTGAYRTVWRLISFHDMVQLLKGLTISSAVLLTVMSYAFRGHELSLAQLIARDTLLAGALLASSRGLRRWWFERDTRRLNQHKGRRTLIFGAGPNGKTLARRFFSDPALRLWPVGFIDDDPDLNGRVLEGVPVLGDRTSLKGVLKTHGVQEMVIAATRLSGQDLQQILQDAHECRIRPRLLSSMGLDRVEAGKLELLRDADIDDLLNRPRVATASVPLEELIRGKDVLVTGGGGSIGGELCKQVLALGPKSLQIMDHSEYNLYKIEQELKTAFSAQAQVLVPLLIDLKDSECVKREILARRPEVVFHAAAYKHVHLVEANPHSAILNNILGMRTLLEACESVGTSTFVLISSDKAVNPVGIMGATKRMCELMVTQHAKKTGKRYCAVRFGNVLGSSGSFIPLMKQQIRNGGPVTITHAEMTRYFMLIREAVALVLSAATISRPGDINILKMGDPIRIVDVAKRLITLLGKKEEDVPIIFTGIRPGEKMHEELYLCGNELQTEHPDILVLPNGDAFRAEAFGDKTLDEAVDGIIRAAHSGDDQAVEELRRIVGFHQREREQGERGKQVA